MKRYVATFHTHLSALLTVKSFEKHGISGRLAPVPRTVSSSCGTCMFYSAEEPMTELLDDDAEGVFEVTEAGYDRVFENA